MTLAFLCLFPPHSDAHLESLGAGRWFGVFPVSGGKGYWGKEAKQSGYLIHLPTHCMPCPVCVWSLGLVRFLCLLQPIHLPFLRRPRHPPASRPHSSKPRHSHPCATSTVRSQPAIFPPHSPWRSQFQEQPSPTSGTSLSLESSSLRKESSSCPLTAPPCPSEVCSFISSSYPRTSD